MNVAVGEVVRELVISLFGRQLHNEFNRQQSELLTSVSSPMFAPEPAHLAKELRASWADARVQSYKSDKCRQCETCLLSRNSKLLRFSVS